MEYDIAVQAKTVRDLEYELQRVIMGHVFASQENGREPFEGLLAAPAEFWEKFDKEALRVESSFPSFRFPKNMPQVETREARVC